MRKGVIFILFLIPVFAFCQYKYTAFYNPSWQYAFKDVNTIKKENVKEKKHSKLLLSIDSRNSVVASNRVKMRGLKIGIEFRDQYRFGVGFYRLKTPIKLESLDKRGGKLEQTLTFKYNAWFTEYLFLQNFRWTGGVMFSFGNGQANLRLRNKELKIDTSFVESKIPIVALNVNGYYHITSWLAPGVGVGYRWVPTSDKQLKSAFQAPFYVIKLKLMLGRLYKNIFRRKLIIAERKEYKAEKKRKKAKRIRATNDK